MTKSWKWFGVQTLYRTAPSGKPLAKDKHYSADVTMVEQRITIFRARSYDEAIRKAEADAKAYAVACPHRNPYGQPVKTRYLGYSDAYLIDDEIASGAEIYSTTEIVSRKKPDSQVIDRLIHAQEPRNGRSLRQNIVNIVFSAPAPGVSLTNKELKFIEKYRTLRRVHDA